MMDVLVNTTVVIILQYVGVSNEHVVHLRVTQWYICYISIKLQGTEGNYWAPKLSIPLLLSLEMISIGHRCSEQYVHAVFYSPFIPFHFGWHHHHHGKHLVSVSYVPGTVVGAFVHGLINSWRVLVGQDNNRSSYIPDTKTRRASTHVTHIHMVHSLVLLFFILLCLGAPVPLKYVGFFIYLFWKIL